MKKILLTVGFFALVLVGRSQTVLNEIYTDPGNQTLRGEFIELYNSSTLPGGQSVDCFTIVTYYDHGGTDRGWYVLVRVIAKVIHIILLCKFLIKKKRAGKNRPRLVHVKTLSFNAC